MAYDHYRDSNGITWQIVTLNKGYKLAANVDDTANPRYATDPPDITVEMDSGGITAFGIPITGGDRASGEQQRVLFTELAGKIEDYAKANVQNTLLVVTASPPAAPPAESGKLALVVLLLLALFSE